MSLAVQSNLFQSNYTNHFTTRNNDDTGFGDALMGKATSLTTSSCNGKNIGITTIGNVGYIAMYADSSTDEEPVIKVGDYEVRVNEVDPKNATRMEMFALMSYMDDVGLTDNHGMKSFNKMTSYTNGGYGNIADASAAWTTERDWTAVLASAKEVFMGMAQTYQQGLNCQSIIDSLEMWSEQISLNGERQERIDQYTDEEWENLLASVDEQIDETKKADEKAVWNWHDGQLGFHAEVFRNEGKDAEYTVKLRYDDGREEERIVDADSINASDCNIIDLHVKMYHLRDEGKITQQDAIMNLALAHVYMNYRTPDADTQTKIDFRSWYEKQLELEMNQGRNETHIQRLLKLLEYI